MTEHCGFIGREKVDELRRLQSRAHSSLDDGSIEAVVLGLVGESSRQRCRGFRGLMTAGGEEKSGWTEVDEVQRGRLRRLDQPPGCVESAVGLWMIHE
jgi:hypothetical protein